jgi:hypothetical protein
MHLQPAADTTDLAAVAQLGSRPTDGEVCELCGAGIGRAHPHLVDPTGQQIVCACAVCSTLFSARAGSRLKRVPDRAQRLDGLAWSEAEWARFGVPVGLAFFVRQSASGDVRAWYPGPTGPLATTVPAGIWDHLVASTPTLAWLQPDVEALLVNRGADARSPLLLVAPIDACYRLVALWRRHWQGSGGPEAWRQVDLFLADLLDHAGPSHD